MRLSLRLSCGIKPEIKSEGLMSGVELCTASRHKLCMSGTKVIGESVWKYHGLWQ